MGQIELPPMLRGAGNVGGLGSPLHLIGQGLDEADAHAVFDRGLAAGMTALDTAHSYAGGASHRTIGSWLAQDPARREQVTIVDKVGVVSDEAGTRLDLTPTNVLAQSSDARERIGVDVVDVVAIHAPFADTPPRETAEAFAELLDTGLARAWGLSNVDAARLSAWLEAADAVGIGPPTIVENGYSLLARGDEAEVLPTCRELGVAYLAYSPLASGALTGRVRRGEQPPDGSMLALRADMGVRLDDHAHDVVEAVRAVAAAHGCAPAAVALAWVLVQPGVHPIIGPRAPHHLDAAINALTLELTDDELASLAAA